MSAARPLSRRTWLGGTGALAAVVAARRRAFAQTVSGPVDPALLEDLVAANRILVDQGVLDGYGHVSVRHPVNPSRYLMARSLAPALVTAADILEYDLESQAINAADKALFIERYIHGEIYKARADVKAVVHNHSPSVIPFGVTGQPLRPLYHMSAFLHDAVPVFDIREATGQMTDMLVRSPQIGAALAKVLGEHPVALMRGHGAVAVGPTLPHVVFRAVYTEMNARLQTQAMALGGPVRYLDPEEARRAEASLDGTLGRPWELWRKKALAR